MEPGLKQNTFLLENISRWNMQRKQTWNYSTSHKWDFHQEAKRTTI